jgi:hypothetical protein
VKSNKGNVILNYGNNVFEGITKEITVDNDSFDYLYLSSIKLLDCNNDGFLDILYDYNGKTVFKNKGDNITFVKTAL